VVLSRTDSKVSDTFDTQLVPDLGQIVALVDLDLVGDDAGAELLIESVLQVPACPRFLHEAANRLFLDTFSICLLVDDQPDFEVLGRVTVLVFAGTLPGDDVGAQRGEPKLEDIICGQGGDHCASVGIDDADSVII
jgi:hypothetical protein